MNLSLTGTLLWVIILKVLPLLFFKAVLLYHLICGSGIFLRRRSTLTDRVGQQLGNYQLVQLLGEGSFAAVYLGGHIHLGTLAAIKVLHAQLTSEDVGTFRTEARIVAHL